MTDQNNTLTAEVRVPMSKDIGGPAKVEEIPLPPPELWGELENSAESEAESKGSAAPEPAPEPVKEIAQLDFVEATVKRVPLDFPFRLDGKVVEDIPVRRMTAGRVDQFLKEHPNGFSSFDVYAAMTGYPAAVLRGLMAEDGEKVTDAALDFLPPAIRRAFDMPAS